MSLKNPVTPPGIDSKTVRLVAQRLNHYASPGKGKDKSKGKVHPITGHEGSKLKSRAIAVLFNFGAIWGWVINATPRPLYPRERPGTHCIEG